MHDLWTTLDEGGNFEEGEEDEKKNKNKNKNKGHKNKKNTKNILKKKRSKCTQESE